jgi:Mn2+/Fe2+ NRAMP family transporter
MMKISEVLFIVALAGGFLVPSAVAGQWWLFGVFMIFFCCFGLVEWIAVKMSRKSVSQHFWKLMDEHPVQAWIIIAGMIMGWVALILHFIIH